MTRTFVIVGGGLAGLSAAAEVRERGFDGRVVVVGEEAAPPYDRPPLSKSYLLGDDTEEAVQLRPPGWYDDEGIELRLGAAVTGLRPATRSLELGDGTEVRCDRLLVASGGRPRRLAVPGAELEGIRYLRTIGDADVLREDLKPGVRLCVVGGGFIGLEVAAAAVGRGASVTVVEAMAAPLQRVLGQRVGEACAALHADAGVTVRTGVAVEAFAGAGRVSAVRLAGGETIPCDVVVVGVGLRPNTDWLEGSGVLVGDGVVVDQYCESSIEGVFAAGDVAQHAHPLFGPLRVEHWQNAIGQGAAAAASMLGERTPYADVHWFWSDQYEHNLQFAGRAGAVDEVVVRGDLAEPGACAFYLTDRRLVGAFGFDAGRDVRRAKRLIESRSEVDRDSLRDAQVDLREIGLPRDPTAAGDLRQ